MPPPLHLSSLSLCTHSQYHAKYLCCISILLSTTSINVEGTKNISRIYVMVYIHVHKLKAIVSKHAHHIILHLQKVLCALYVHKHSQAFTSICAWCIPYLHMLSLHALSTFINDQLCVLSFTCSGGWLCMLYVHAT